MVCIMHLALKISTRQIVGALCRVLLFVGVPPVFLLFSCYEDTIPDGAFSSYRVMIKVTL